ncbi:MAG: pyruvate kinase [Oscillospiraceae bacterium]|jgi:pyruvate kinase|nr:pyruvate kinase [Oscillospiraceae bacterium]
MKKTKIICTLGPSTETEETLRGMIKAGMNVARFNFSHGTHESHGAMLSTLKKVRGEMGAYVGALLDTKGPEVRLKTFKEPVTLKEGGIFVLTPFEREGDETGCSITHKTLATDVSIGTKILLDDGLVELRVKELRGDDVVCDVKNTGVIKSNKSVNIPGVRLSMAYLSKKDEDDVVFGIKAGFDFIAASFVSRAQDVLDIRRVLDKHKCHNIRVIAKIENSDGVNNISEILAVSDGIMVARGDMGVEIDYALLPSIQKKLIHHCLGMGKPAITATQMLESMIVNPRPTRAEVSDVANAIYDGTSAVMLSGETAAGKYPVEAVGTMARIAEDTEKDINYARRFYRYHNERRHLGVADAVCHSTCATAIDVEADAILTVTKSGETARLLSKYRPNQPIYACVIDEHIARHLFLSWGVYPIIMPIMQSTDEVLKKSEELCFEAGYIKNGDIIVVAAGLPVGASGTTNMIKVHLVGESLISGAGIGKGSGSGTVCVCRTEEDVKTKFKPGNVLVIPSTSNNILEYIRQASAIITEEPGANSHAAIVGLTLDKPVIVGAIAATKTLADGLHVSVDAERGVVHQIDRAE